jgi:PAS domain S-box-containing protein
MPLPLQDKSVRNLTVSVSADGSAAEDVTDAEALRQSEERFRQLADAMPQLVWTAEPDGRVDYYNSRIVEFSGFERNADGTYSWEPVLHPDDLEASVGAWTTALRTGEKYEVAHRVMGADGTYRWFLSRGMPVLDERGRIRKWYGTATDIDDQKKAETALLEADRRKTEFLAVLSHELRNPLTPIRNSVFILEHAEPGSPRAKQAQQVIDRQVRHMTRLVDDLLDVTRISRGSIQLQKERLELGELVRRVAEDHRSIFGAAGLQLQVDTGQGPLLTCGDPTRLAQVIGNLLHNAAKFTPPGGRVALVLEREGEKALIRVQDNGMGLAPELEERVFEPFMQAHQTLERGTGGLGLGLALVKGLVEMHGGSVAARSDGPGKGAEFRVQLALEPVAGALQRPGEGSGAGGRAYAHQILVIEDNVDAAESLRDVLQLCGHEVEVALTGLEGLEKARLGGGPRVILCDIGLPGLDGFGVARAIRADPGLGGCYLVALSGYALQEDVDKSLAAGFDRHLAKPPDMALLESLLASVGEPGIRRR